LKNKLDIGYYDIILTASLTTTKGKKK
jgi:hypothetical protein